MHFIAEMAISTSSPLIGLGWSLLRREERGRGEGVLSLSLDRQKLILNILIKVLAHRKSGDNKNVSGKRGVDSYRYGQVNR